MPHSLSHSRRLLCVLALACAMGASACKRESAGSLPPKQLLERAWKEFRLEDFDLAERDFKTVLSVVDRQKDVSPEQVETNKKLRLNAMYGLGLVASLGHHGDDPARTKRLLNDLITQNPGSEMAAWASLALAREEYLPVRSDAPEKADLVKTLYAGVIERYPGSAAAEEAFAYEQALGIQSLEPEAERKAIAAIDEHLSKDPECRFRYSLYGLKARAHRFLGEHRKSLDMLVKAIESREVDPTNPNQNNAFEYYNIALVAQYDVGDAATARKYYGLFLEKYPKDQKAFTVKMQLERLAAMEAQLRAELDGKPTTAPSVSTSQGGPR